MLRRYEVVSDAADGYETPHGKWVRYEDAQAEIDAHVRALRSIRGILRGPRIRCADPFDDANVDRLLNDISNLFPKGE